MTAVAGGAASTRRSPPARALTSSAKQINAWTPFPSIFRGPSSVTRSESLVPPAHRVYGFCRADSLNRPKQVDIAGISILSGEISNRKNTRDSGFRNIEKSTSPLRDSVHREACRIAIGSGPSHGVPRRGIATPLPRTELQWQDVPGCFRISSRGSQAAGHAPAESNSPRCRTGIQRSGDYYHSTSGIMSEENPDCVISKISWWAKRSRLDRFV